MANQTNPTSNFNVTCNFEAIFATINDAAIIKAIANNIMTQLKQAHDARIAQLKGAATTAPTVEVAVAAPEPPKAKGKTKKEAAKEPKTAKAKTEPKAKAEKAEDTPVSLSDTKALAKLNLTFEPFGEASYVLRGDTKPLRKVLREELRGLWNPRLSDGQPGWIFPARRAQDVADALGLKIG